MAINTTTWDLRGMFKDGVVFTEKDISRAKRYTDLRNLLFVTPLEQSELAMLRTQLIPLINKEHL